MQYLTISYFFGLLVIGHANPPLIPIATIEHIPNPSYSFNYAVNDPSTGDNKGQWETRNGDAVKGSYSLVEPDGTLRVVDYFANDLTGFNAVVKRLGPAQHPIQVPIKTFTPIIMEPFLPGKTVAPIIPAPILPIKPMAPMIPTQLLKPIQHIPASYMDFNEPLPSPVPLTTHPVLMKGPIYPMTSILDTMPPRTLFNTLNPVPEINPLAFAPLIIPNPFNKPSGRSVTLSGATYGKKGVINSWRSSPIFIGDRTLTIRHKH